MLNLFLSLLYLTSTLASPTTPSHHHNPPPPHHHRPISSYTAQDIITNLNLTSNPEGGFYVQTFQDPHTCNNRSASTAIYYLLEGSTGESLWHRVDDAEVWHWYAGAALTLSLSWDNGSATREEVLGSDLFEGMRPQIVVERDQWQRARSEGAWTLVGTTVAPGFVQGTTVIKECGWMPKGA